MLEIKKINILLNSEDHQHVELAFQLIKSIGLDKMAFEHNNKDYQRLIRLITNSHKKILKCIENGFVSFLQELTFLDLCFDHVQHLLRSIFQIKNLKELILSNCNLSEINPEIKNLQKIENLYLKSNQLVSLPSEIGFLSTIKHLDLRNNQLESLPKDIRNLKNIKTLYLDGNPILINEIYKIKNMLPQTEISFSEKNLLI